MKAFQGLKSLSVGMACWGILFPQSVLLADGPATIPKNATSIRKDAKSRKSPVLRIGDVALTGDGTLTGQLLDTQGVALDGAVISIWRGDQKVAEVTTDQDGVFVISQLPAGLYKVVAPQARQLFRFWAPNTAPPSAKTRAVVVSGPVVRGQLGPPIFGPNHGLFGAGALGTTLILAGIAAAIAIPIAVHNANQDDDPPKYPASP